MLYLIRLDVRQPDGISLSEFREIWYRGAMAGLLSRSSGIIQSFKVVGRSTIFAIAEFPDNEALDEALAELPIVEDLGSAVEIEVIPVLSYDKLDTSGRASAEPAEESVQPEVKQEQPEEVGQITEAIHSLDAAGPTQPEEVGQITQTIRGLDATLAKDSAEAEDQATVVYDSPGQNTLSEDQAAAEPTAPSGPRALLRPIDGPTNGGVFEIDQAGATIGRSPDNSIQMLGEKLSRWHARIEFKDDGYWLIDLGSSNGTFVNQTRLSAPHRLQSGDVIKFGTTCLSVTLRAEPEN